jgi:hypothetical protein
MIGSFQSAARLRAKTRISLIKETEVTVSDSQGNENLNRRRVSDLAPSYAAVPQKGQKGQAPTGSFALNKARIEPSASAASKQNVPQPHLLVLPSATSRAVLQRSLAELLFRTPGTWADRENIQQRIGTSVLRVSKSMETRNFHRVGKQDLESMAEAYDELFFQGLCLPLARSYGLSFRLSARMTRAGGKTTRTIYRGTRSKPSRTHYEIAISTSLLFQSFRKPNDSIRVCGHDCIDRLTAMQRIVEHEMIHLCEMLAWIQSDCSASRFQSIARNMFGHTEHKHELITQQERAAKEFNIRAGANVAFPFEGRLLHGVVNRITRRATILVEDPRGERYSNGKRYLKYYVPIQQLRPIT